MDRKEAAQRLGFQTQTLKNWAARGLGPRFIRIGRSIRYRPRDLDEYMESRVVDPAGSGKIS